MTSNKSVYLFIGIFLFVSCKKSNSVESGTTFPESFQFVWQDESEDDGDELGVYFTDSEIYAWDYLGDSYDEGPDCYFVDIGAELVSYEGDNYRLVFVDIEDGARETGEVSIQLKSGQLVVEEDGESFPHSKTDLSASQLTPECDFDFKRSEAKTVKFPLFDR